MQERRVASTCARCTRPADMSSLESAAAAPHPPLSPTAPSHGDETPRPAVSPGRPPAQVSGCSPALPLLSALLERSSLSVTEAAVLASSRTVSPTAGKLGSPTPPSLPPSLSLFFSLSLAYSLTAGLLLIVSKSKSSRSLQQKTRVPPPALLHYPPH